MMSEFYFLSELFLEIKVRLSVSEQRLQVFLSTYCPTTFIITVRQPVCSPRGKNQEKLSAGCSS